MHSYLCGHWLLLTIDNVGWQCNELSFLWSMEIKGYREVEAR